eukprot:CAMPEP_0118881596 /NCGR_PEP_ID=MMETSP1163-20130328/21020_1 /TAXON_ID=124430 /ORGANISM="Phaeomonas parva, Strain CCMP2877" /LENGTH=353 /DNA_ID=CAMNT_0006818413 /DNA_START=170 /DNA_END=1231 /DNA_ORIENTATION=+
MTRVVALAAAAVAAATATEYGLSFELTEALPTREAALPVFDAWRAHHGKKYLTAAHEARALDNFIETSHQVAAQNTKPDRTWTAGLNKFADMSWPEFKSFYGLDSVGAGQNCSATRKPMELQEIEATHRRLLKLPDSIDWRDYAAVSPVKDQGQCGSCWTFSTTGAMESHHFLDTGDMVSLAEQQLVDCAQAFDNHGCEGGLPSHAFQYIYYAGGIMGEEDYPYTAKDGTCAFDVDKIEATVLAQFNITAGDEVQLGEAVGTYGPVSVAFQVASDFKSYTGGVYTSTVCKSGPEDVNHAVLDVGYGVDADSGLDYWIIKNSWGTDWGMDGFFWMERGVNMCGVANCNSFPIAG